MKINYTTGYAGTGKSTALLNQLHKLPLSSYDTTVVLSPTHKAAHRLAPSVPTGIEIKTIHSLLRWIPTINEDAEHISHIDVVTKLGRELKDYTHFIIDEGGMLSEEMFMELTSKIEEATNFETDGIVIDVYLDPYQLLPVKGKQIQIDEDSVTRLTTQYRSESKDIVELYTKFVNYIEGINLKDLTIPASDNVVYISESDAIKKFDISKDRLLAYTNEKVGYYNQAIAKHNKITSYTNQLVQLGALETHYKVDNFVDYDEEQLGNALDADILYLQNSRIIPKYRDIELASLANLKGVKFAVVNDKVVPVIAGIANYHKLSKEIKEEAIKDKSKFRFVYALNKCFVMDFIYASTVHKAQGSEFDVVYIDKKDLQKSILSNYYTNYARLMYVALSRAKKKVYIID